MSASGRKLADDCFAFDDKNRMTHAEVLAAIDARVTRVVGEETVAIADSCGRILNQDVTAPRPVPAFDNSAVDGYAFRHADYAESNTLTLAGRMAAGDTQTGATAAGTCVRIFTGAIMPDGLDTVAMQEDCTIEGDAIVIPLGLKPGANRRRAGEDVAPGDVIATTNQVLAPADIAAIAASGHGAISVRSKLRIGILSTGNEIIQPGEAHDGSAVYDANRPMLSALANRAHAELIDLGHCRDDADAIRDLVADAANRCDLIITSGGASRGDEDHLFDVLTQLGRAHIWQIAIKPGRPMMMGQIGDTVLMALPGNPVAAMVCFLLYGRPVIAKLTGADWHPPMGFDLPAGFSIAKKKPNRREFLRGWRERDDATGALVAQKFARDGSGLISGLRAAEGLIMIDEAATSVKEGDMVRFIPFFDMEL